MNYFSILYIVIFLSVLLLGIWIYSEKNLKGKYNKLINYLSFPLALLGLYSVFRLNIDFSYVLVSLIIASLFLWILGKSISLKKLAKESRSFFIILSLITIFRSFIFEPFQIPSESFEKLLLRTPLRHNSNTEVKLITNQLCQKNYKYILKFNYFHF